MNRAVFLDRDGTVIEDVGHNGDPRKVNLLPGAAEAIRKLNQAGLSVFLITNQSGIGMKLFGKMDVALIHAVLFRLLAKEGAVISRVYTCPHVDEDKCGCRKPRPGLFYLAACENEVSLEESFMVGDSDRDIQAGEAAGCHCIKLDEQIDLAKAVDQILGLVTADEILKRNGDGHRQ